MNTTETFHPNLRERKKVKLRELMINTALELFTKRGYDETTIDDIVAKIEISKRTFFRYFETKEDVAIAWYDQLVEKAQKTLDSNLSNETPTKIIKFLFSDFISMYENDRKHFLAIETLIAKTPSIRAKKMDKLIQCSNQINRLLENKIGATSRKIFKNHLIITFIIGIFTVSIDTWVSYNGKENLSKLVDQGFKLIENNKIL